MEFLRRYWWLLSVVALAIGLALLAPHQAQYDPTNPYSYQKATEVSAPSSGDERLADYTLGLEIFTGIVAVFTIFLAGASIYQGYITKGALDLARDEFNATHRPCIEMQRIFRENFAPGQHPRISFLLANEGESSARIERIDLAIEILPNLPPVRSPERWDEHYSDIDLPARSGFPLSATRLGVFTAAEFDASITTGFRRIYLIVNIEYADANGRRRGKALCFQFDRDRNRFVLENDPNYTFGS